jgi:transketolase
VNSDTLGNDTDLAAVAAEPLDARGRHLRGLILRALEGGGRGHVGSALSVVEVVRVLYDDVLRHRSTEPRWPGRDRFLLSKGHGCLALYAVLADHGYFPLHELDRFCCRGSILGGHPEMITPGVEAATGALGHGLSIGVGMALALRASGGNQRVYVLMGDGEINEGSVWEAAASASKHRLTNLTALVDYNKMQSAGSVFDILNMEPLAAKWAAFGFAVGECNGHSLDELRQVLSQTADKPRLLVCHTIKGKGVPEAENNAGWHHKSRLSDSDLARLRAALGVA